MTSSKYSTYSMGVSVERIGGYAGMAGKCTSWEPVEGPATPDAFHAGLAVFDLFRCKLLSYLGLRSMNTSKGAYGGNASGVGHSYKKIQEKKHAE